MNWRQTSPHCLMGIAAGQDTAWRIFRYGIDRPPYYELWFGNEFHGTFNSAAEAQQEQERIVGA
jgi:hypothetical protein